MGYFPAWTFASSTASGSSDAEDVDKLGNKFDALKVYEPSDEFLNAPDDDIVYEAEPSSLLEDALIAFGMMIADLKAIRNYISHLWTNLPGEGGSRYDPAVLAVVSNTGLEFAANIVEDAAPVFEPHGGAVAICDKYCKRILQTDDFSSWVASTDPDDQIIQYQFGSQNYLNVVPMFQMLAAVPRQQTTPVYSEGAFGVYDPESDLNSRTFSETWLSDEGQS
ncbi:hypothetical protein ACHAP5_011810 [Fusarium lateritium]